MERQWRNTRLQQAAMTGTRRSPSRAEHNLSMRFPLTIAFQIMFPLSRGFSCEMLRTERPSVRLFFHSSSSICDGLRVADRSGGGDFHSDPADCAVTGSGATAGYRHQQLHWSERSDGGIGGDHSIGTVHQWRGGYEVHFILEHQ